MKTIVVNKNVKKKEVVPDECIYLDFVDVITLHIRKVGWWTGKLFDKVYNLERTTERLEHVDQAFKLHVKLYMEGMSALITSPEKL